MSRSRPSRITRRPRCSACDALNHTRSTCPRVYTVRQRRTARQWTETIALREAIWQQLSFRFPRAPHELYQAISDDWGEIKRRRFQRALSWLRHHRPIVAREVACDVQWLGQSVETTTIGYMRRVA